jgi:hypothetical protein
MKNFFSILSLALTLTSSFSASVSDFPSSSESTSAAATAENPTSTLALSKLIQEARETQANIIEGRLLSLTFRFDALTERGQNYTPLIQHLAAHAEKCEDPNAFPGYGIILEDMRANPNTEAAAEAIENMANLIHLITSGSLSQEVLSQVVAKLDERKAIDLAVRKAIIAKNQQTLTIATLINNRLLDQLKEAFATELGKLEKYKDAEIIDKWKIESPIITETSDTETESLPDIASLIRDIQEYTATVSAQESKYTQSEIDRLKGDNDQRKSLVERRVRDLALTAGAEDSIVAEMIKALEKDITETEESIGKNQRGLEALNR